jgi:hypothetical protein
VAFRGKKIQILLAYFLNGFHFIDFQILDFRFQKKWSDNLKILNSLIAANIGVFW